MKNSDMPAMPLTGSALTDFGAEANGLTKREYFAGLAMQAMLSNPNVIGFNPMRGWDLVNCSNEQLAQFCIEHAYALLAALENQNDPT